MRLLKWLSAVSGAVLLVPVNAFAFAVGVSFTDANGNPTLPYVNESLNIVFSVSGVASDITGLYIDLIPDALFPSFGGSDVAVIKRAVTTGAPIDTEGPSVPGVPGLQWRLFPKNNGEIFSIIDGRIVDIYFLALTPRASPEKPFTSVMGFNFCTGDQAGDLTCAPGAAPVNFLVRDGGNTVPEPTTVWLALAALVAGAAVFRKSSKRS